MIKRIIFILFVLQLFQMPMVCDSGDFTFLTLKKMPVTILKREYIKFVYAELHVFYQPDLINSTVPILTGINMLEPKLNSPDTFGLFSLLGKMGNDYAIEYHVDKFILKINFLPQHISLFTKFLKNLYTYRPFTMSTSELNLYKRQLGQRIQRKFNLSKKKFWELLFNYSKWERLIAYQIGYNKMFQKHQLGRPFINPQIINTAKLSDIRYFYNTNFTPPNSLLILKGNINPYITVGYIQNAFKSYKTKEKAPPEEKKKLLKINNSREYIIFHLKGVDSPTLYWFLGTYNQKNTTEIPYKMINNALFGDPIGRLRNNLSITGIKRLNIESQTRYHPSANVICNQIQLNYRDIERFILFADQHFRHFTQSPVNRNEFLHIKNYIYGKEKVKTTFYKSEISDVIRLHNMANLPSAPSPTFSINSHNPYFSINISLKQINSYSSPLLPNQGVIVIVGDANQILKHLTTLKPSVVRIVQ